MLIILLILIFLRPFISSLASPSLNYLHSSLLMALLLSWLISKKIPIQKLSFIKYSLMLLLLSLIISISFSRSKVASLEEFYKYICGLALFIIAASLKYEETKRIIIAMILSSVIISLLAIYQYLFGLKHLLAYVINKKITDPFILDYIERNRVFFPFVTPNILAGYLAMFIPLYLIYKNYCWFVIPLSLALFFTKSIGGILSLCLGLAVYFYLQNKFKKREFIFILGLLVIIGLIIVLRSAIPKQHTQPLFSIILRLDYWKETLKIIYRYPLTGIGVGNFNLAQSRYAHNSYLQIWAEIGILGLISFLWLLIALFRHCLSNIKEISNRKQTLALISANVIFLAHNFIDFSFFLPEVSLLWWLILGLTLQSK